MVCLNESVEAQAFSGACLEQRCCSFKEGVAFIVGDSSKQQGSPCFFSHRHARRHLVRLFGIAGTKILVSTFSGLVQVRKSQLSN